MAKQTYNGHRIALGRVLDALGYDSLHSSDLGGPGGTMPNNSL